MSASEQNAKSGAAGRLYGCFSCVSNNDESLSHRIRFQYELGESRYTVDEALAKDGIYSAPLKATFRILHAKRAEK